MNRGAVISVVGPDGSGKSTLIEGLTSGILKSKSVVMSRTVGILPRRYEPRGTKPEPHKDPPYWWGLSVAKTLYLFIDYLLGWVFKVRPFAKTGGWLVIQRGWWDIAVDPRRYRIGGSGRLPAFLGRFLPHPEVLLVLEAPAQVVYGRKSELPHDEISRQTEAWHRLISNRQQRAYIDATLGPDEVLRSAEAELVRLLTKKNPSQSVGLPKHNNPRFVLPRNRQQAIAGLHIYQPVTLRGLVGWNLGRVLAGTGVLRLLPAPSIPNWIADRVAPFVPENGAFALSKANHPARYVALIVGEDGDLKAVAKVAGDENGRRRLEQEARNLALLGPLLPYPLYAPRVFESHEGLLLLEPVRWEARLRSWRLSADVAFALGRFFRGEAETGAEVGQTHGDFAPWNLFRTKRGWAVIDWEEAGMGAAFFDLFHYLTQGHALLRRPSKRTLLAGLDGRGWVGDAIHAYSEGAKQPTENAPGALRSYLESSLEKQDASTPDGRKGIRARKMLIRSLSGS